MIMQPTTSILLIMRQGVCIQKLKEPAVVAFSLCKDYMLGDIVVKALKDVSFQVDEGEFVSISGPSGSGKTTLLNIIGGLDTATSGSIKVFGHDLSAHDEDFLATFHCAYIGFVFQSYNLISTLTSLENVAFAIEIAGWSAEKALKKAEKLLKTVGLSHRSDHFPSQLSGGEQQRIAFIRALANDPLLVLVDEPTGNLDFKTGFEVVKILEGLKQKGKTVIVATHDERIIELSNLKLRMLDGRISEADE